MPQPKQTTWVAVLDGQKALLLENTGTDLKPDLTVLSKEVLDNPPTREQGTDRPGRYPDSGEGQRSAVQTTDWHEMAEADFAKEFAERLNKAAYHKRFDRLVLVAPPKVLGDLRAAVTDTLSQRIVAEVRHDLTNHPVPEIAEHVKSALKPGF
jgi:protein required for attachment to host cells